MWPLGVQTALRLLQINKSILEKKKGKKDMKDKNGSPCQFFATKLFSVDSFPTGCSVFSSVMSKTDKSSEG